MTHTFSRVLLITLVILLNLERCIYTLCFNELTCLLPFSVTFLTIGMFIWLNFRKYLKASSWEAEREVYDHCVAGGIIVCPGQAFASPTPGFFRMCFAASEEPVLRTGLKRLQAVLEAL